MDITKPFPLPDHIKKLKESVPLPTPGHDPVKSAPKITPEERLQRDEDIIGSILDTHLKLENREDPTILAFIQAYIHCRDIRQASLEIGITPAIGRRIKNRKDVHKAIMKLSDALLVRGGLDPMEIVTKVREVMEVDIGEFQNEDGSYKVNLKDLPPEIRRSIRKFKVKNLYATDPNGMKYKEGELIEVELYDKLKATELLGREEGLFKETTVVEHGVTQGMKDLLLGGLDKANQAKQRVIKDVNGGETG